MNWYIIFVKSGKEQTVVEFLRRVLDPDKWNSFVPLAETLFKKGGHIFREWKLLFPSYVFIESHMPCGAFFDCVYPLIYQSKNILKVLRYSETEIALRKTDQLLLRGLLDENHCLGASVGIKVGEQVHIESGPLKGIEDKIKKINRHKRVAKIELPVMDEIKEVTVALEIVSKQSDLVV